MTTHHQLSRRVLPFALTTLLLSLLITGFNGVSSAKPFNPATPVTRQAQASMKGVVALPPGDENLCVFQMNKIALYALTDVLTNSSICTRISLETTTRLDEISAPDSSVGLLEIGDIEANLYTTATCGRGSHPATEPIELERSELVTVDLKQVTADVPPLSSAIAGLIRLEGPGHQGRVGIH